MIETEDVRYLLKLDDYEILPEVDLTELNEAWINIQTQYAEAENSNSSVIQFITAKSLHKMETEYLMLWDIYNLLSIAPEAAKEVIKKAGLEGKGLEWIEKRIKALINRIKIKRKDIEYDTPTKKPNFLLIIDEIEDIKGRSLDIMKITVRKYLAIKENIKKKNGKKGQDRTRRHN